MTHVTGFLTPVPMASGTCMSPACALHGRSSGITAQTLATWGNVARSADIGVLPPWRRRSLRA
jgi:hypothetical protein